MLLGIVKKYGPIKAASFFTIIIVLIAVSTTYLFVFYLDPPVYLYQMMLPTFVPITLFFFPAIYFFDILHKLDSTEKNLQEKNIELEKSIKDVKILEGLFPICSSCKSIRDDDGHWNQIETYIANKSDATFSHSLCPDCVAKLYPTLKNDDK